MSLQKASSRNAWKPFCILFSFLWLHASGVAAGISTTITPGPTPFISDVTLGSVDLSSLQSIEFTIAPKRGSYTRPVSARYSLAYLRSRGYVDNNNATVMVPVFGLYQNFANSVDLLLIRKGGASSRKKITIQTPPFNDTSGAYLNPVVLQSRLKTTTLSYDFILIKNWNSANTPIIVDTDSEVRWVGTAGVGTQSALLYKNGIYISDAASGLIRQEWDGGFSALQDYSEIGVTYTGHHNIDYGKYGMILDVNTTGTTECVTLEVDEKGTVQNIWNFAEIIRTALLDGGEDPGAVSDFIGSPSKDWFHNNAVTYNKHDDSIIASSRENFVICVDYSTKQLKWILGDTSKAWYRNFKSLRKYALTLTGVTLPPIGQHALSIASDGDLLLFDDGLGSFNQSPAGNSRTYSAPRKYAIDSRKMTAKEVWHYEANQQILSTICSSVYEDEPSNYLIDYANEVGGPELRGLDSAGKLVFDYQYSGGFDLGWNAMPIHMENIVFP